MAKKKQYASMINISLEEKYVKWLRRKAGKNKMKGIKPDSISRVAGEAIEHYYREDVGKD